ncbi:hypothetical protein CFO_g427 [Ceratocystis platani]|uniref:Uncharacterized protein n=1 Tax=Ceratocystis fimbriata f. sp. platani TaxID=88771 RepID=A0A0F8D3K0_CERFI|nr:hypothetical protein CFO_g427 [Ceratocystis platani]
MWEEQQQRHYRASLAATTSSQSACPSPSLKPGISFEQRGVQQLERLVRDRMRSKLHKKQISRNRQDRCNVHMQSGSRKPGGSDENKVKLGHTLRILQDRLPTLLQSPLPQHILAPNISLHLFPSTHPHLPTVSGRVAYTAALWTSPIAWNRVPLVGNVRVDIVSERMMKEPLAFAPRRDGALPEQLVVRWRTVPDGDGTNSGGEGMLSSVGRGKAAGPSTPSQTASGTRGDEDFTGLYIFQFDGEGRILSHTIELAQAGGRWEQGVGAKVVGLTDWLLGEIKGKPDSGSACPAFERPEESSHEDGEQH